MSWCVNTNRKDGYRGEFGGSYLLPHYLLPRKSGMVHVSSRITSISGDFVPHVHDREHVAAYEALTKSLQTDRGIMSIN